MNHLHFENILSNAKAIYGTLKAAPECPNEEMLSDYVYNDLPAEEHRKIAAHIHQCERCRIESLRMKTDKEVWEVMIDKYPDEIFEKLLGSSISEHYAADLSKIVTSAASKIRDSLIQWLSPIWEPMWAGVPVSAAADIPEQSHSFEMNYGEYVNISCYWQGKSNDLTPYIQLSWNANIYTNSNLWARFVNPENQQILAEYCLGIELEGRKTFYESELGFDPSKQKWAISIVIEKI